MQQRRARTFRILTTLSALGFAAGCAASGSMTSDPGSGGGTAGSGPTPGTAGSGPVGGSGPGGSSSGVAGSGSGAAGTTGVAGSGSGAAGTTGVAGSGSGAAGTTGVAGSGSGRGGSTASAGSGGSATGAAGSGSGTLALTGLKIEANTKNVLSCFVSWTTSQAASSIVQFGAGKYEWEISDAALVTDHKVLVIGMHAQAAYQIKAISTNSSGSGSAEGTFTAGKLPASVPVAQVTVNETAKVQPGWTLMNIQKGDGTPSARATSGSQAVMYDAGGQPVWYYLDGGSAPERGGAISVDLTDKGVLIGGTQDANLGARTSPREVDFAGNTIWQCPDVLCGGTGNLTHHTFKLPNGNYVMNRDVASGSGTSPVFEERSPDGKLVWSLDYKKFVPMPSGKSGDWCHGNSIWVDMANNAVYANCRWMGLIKTTYTNPSLVWHLPAKYGAGTNGTITFSPAASQFSDTHDPEIHSDGTVLFFDNGGFSGAIEEGNPGNRHTRAVEYKIDEAQKTATLVWEFPGTFTVDAWYKTNLYVPFWGDADRLKNGNVMITAGVRGTMATTQSRVFEVTKADGKVVWEFKLPPDHGVYRSERITPPLVHAIP